jgi:hypothetical protein
MFVELVRRSGHGPARAFAVTIEHHCGSTDIPAPLERIVTVVLTNHAINGMMPLQAAVGGDPNTAVPAA